MKYLPLLFGALLVTGCKSNETVQPSLPSTYAVAELLADFDKALAGVFVAARDNGLRLTEAKLDLKTVVTNDEHRNSKSCFLA